MWTDEDDDALTDVMSYTPGRSWPEISRKAFPDGRHDKTACMERWKILSRPKGSKGPWSGEEDHRLVSLVQEFGAERWVVIASKLKTRTGKQCRERWHNHLDPESKSYDIRRILAEVDVASHDGRTQNEPGIDRVHLNCVS